MYVHLYISPTFFYCRFREQSSIYNSINKHVRLIAGKLANDNKQSYLCAMSAKKGKHNAAEYINKGALIYLLKD